MQEHLYSRLTGIDASRSIVRRYQRLRRALPSTFFLCRFLDIQAFTAIIVLMLVSYSAPPSSSLNTQADRAEIQRLVDQVIDLMDEKSSDDFGTNFARHGVFTIRALNDLFRQDEDSSNGQELTLKVPLLGKLHVRRNARVMSTSESSVLGPQLSSDPNIWKPSEYAVPQHNPASLVPDANVGGSQIQAQWPWDPLSWSLENNHEDLFQDAFMAGDFDYSTILQDAEGGDT